MKRVVLIWGVLFIMIGCEGKSNEIAKIPEASGICFSKKSQTLFVAQDEGKVFEISKEGNILREKWLGKYNLEGVACDDIEGELLFAVEGKDNILVVNQKNLEIKNNIKIKRAYNGKVILIKDRKSHGIEGIAIVEDYLYISNQSNKFLPKKDPSLLIKVKKSTRKKVAILELVEHGYKDVSGLTYHDKHLFMVSDSKNLLIKYSLKKQRVVGTAKLPKFAQEGVAFDDKGCIYFANDKGSVYKYQRQKFGL